MALRTFDDAVNLTMFKMNDVAGSKWTPETLALPINEAIRRIAEQFRDNGAGQFRVTGTISLAATVTASTRGGIPNGYPSDLIAPAALYERNATSTLESDYVLMTQVDALPRRSQDIALLEWLWADDQIQFVGCTQARSISIDYIGGDVADISGSTSLPVEGSLDAVATYAAAFACGSIEDFNREADLLAQADRMVERLISVQTKVRQGVNLRRRAAPYSRAGLWPGSYGG